MDQKTKENINFKKVYETIDRYEESTWMSNSSPFMETEYTGVFHDRYPAVPGHSLFVPKKNIAEYIGKSYQLAYEFGNKKIKDGEITGFNVGMNIGLSAGQTFMWPHIHFIPRHDNDSPTKIGGIRHAHPGADHTKHY